MGVDIDDCRFFCVMVMIFHWISSSFIDRYDIYFIDVWIFNDFSMNIYIYIYICIYCSWIFNAYHCSMVLSFTGLFPTCQVRVVRFYQSCRLLLPPPPPPPPPSPRLLLPPDLNYSHPRQVLAAGPQPRPSQPSVGCRTPTTASPAQCWLPDLNHHVKYNARDNMSDRMLEDMSDRMSDRYNVRYNVRHNVKRYVRYNVR